MQFPAPLPTPLPASLPAPLPAPLRARVFCLALAICQFGFLLLATLCPSHASALDETTALRLLADSLGHVNDSNIQVSLMEGMLSGLAGRRDVPPPENWATVSQRLAASESARVRELASQLAQIFGDESAMERAWNSIQDRTLDVEARRRALQALVTQRDSRAAAALEKLLAEPALRTEAVRGFAAVGSDTAPGLLLTQFVDWKPEERRAVIETLASRKAYADRLLEALQNGVVTKQEIPSHVARSLSLLLGRAFTEEFGEVRELAQDRRAKMKAFKTLLTPETLADGDASRGRVVFKKTCAACHLLYGEGGRIGPDLTGSNRANLDYLLLNSVDPSYDVPESYKMVVVRTIDGRVVSGVVAEEDARRLILKTVEQPRVVLLKSDIEARRLSDKSMMPEGQLDQMKPQQLIDLVKYLQSVQQVELP